MRNLIFLLFASISAFAQVNPTSFSKIKVTNQTKNNNATRVVVQDSITKEFHWVLKSNLGGGSTTVPTLQQVTLSGNNITNNIITTGYYQATNYLGGGMHGFVNLKGSGLEIGTNANRNAGSPFALIMSDNLTGNHNFQLPDEDGTFATRQWVTANSATTPTLQQVLTAGNTYTSNTYVNPVFSVSNTYNDGTLDFTKYKIELFPMSLRLYTTDNSSATRIDFGGFENNISNNLIAKLSAFEGIKLKTNISGGVATVKSDNVTTDIVLQNPNKSGTFALTSDTTGLVRVANAAAIPAANTQPVGVFLLDEATNKMYRNDGTKWQGL